MSSSNNIKKRNMEQNIKIYPRSIVCEESNLCGDITISTGCIVHPSATIIAEAGPIIFGENCIIEEYATIIYRLPKNHKNDDDETVPAPVLRIGSNNIFEVGCRVEALQIGDKNTFECKSYVSSDVTISNGCIIGTGCRLEGKYNLTENTVIYGNNCSQREALEKQGSQTLQTDFLRKILPNYHHLRKSTVDIKKVDPFQQT